MKFKIDFDIAQKPIDSNWPTVFLIGSCFATEQAIRMKNLKMEVYSNPFGIIYNPKSIERILKRLVHSEYYTSSDFIQREHFFSWEHHGSHKFESVSEAIATCNRTIDNSSSYLSNADIIVITLGTSIVYKHKNIIVANCHKLPNKEFTQDQLTSAEVKDSLITQIRLIRKINTHAEIIFTVSPVRHIRSGVIQNTQSKSVLISQLHEALNEVPDVKTSYFPAYEIFTDELRDYRFSKEDMVHPTSAATSYIWERFIKTYLNTECQETLEAFEKLRQLQEHRPKDEIKHKATIAHLIKKLQNTYPNINIS